MSTMRTLVLAAVAAAALASCGAETVILLEIAGSVQVPTDIDTVAITIRKNNEVVFPRDSRDVSEFKLPGQLPQSIAIVGGETVRDGKLTILVTGKRNNAFKMSKERDVNMEPGKTTNLQIALTQ